MSNREFDSDGTDTYHPEHPWEQTTHALYVSPDRRTKANWPPVSAFPAGPAEALRWSLLPDQAPKLKGDWYRQFGPASPEGVEQ